MSRLYDSDMKNIYFGLTSRKYCWCMHKMLFIFISFHPHRKYHNVFLLFSWNHKKITKVSATAANVKNIMSLIFFFSRYILIPIRLCVLQLFHVYSYILWFGHQRHDKEWKFCLRHKFLKEGIHIYIQWWYWGFYAESNSTIGVEILRWHQVRFSSYWDDKI